MTLQQGVVALNHCWVWMVVELDSVPAALVRPREASARPIQPAGRMEMYYPAGGQDADVLDR